MQKPGLYLYLLPTYKQAKKVIWLDPEMMKHFPAEAILKKNDTELYIKLPCKGGGYSIWLLGGADEPDSWRGTNPVDVVLDEYAEMKETIWTDFLRPVLTQNGGTCTFVFTPKGKNHAYRLLEFAKKNAGKFWNWFVMNVEDTKSIAPEELEQAKKEMPQAVYLQEFMCAFLDDATQVFRRFRENSWDGELKIFPGKQFIIGADLAKMMDWTVLTPFDLNSFRVGTQDRFNQVDWNLQKAKMESMGYRFNKAKLRVDATGVGGPIYEDLYKSYGNVEPFTFTEDSRSALLQNLAILLEQDKIKVPNDEGLFEELAGARYEIGQRGKIHIVWPENVPTDRVMSLALAVWGLPAHPYRHDSVRPQSSEFSKDLADVQRSQTSRFHY